MIMLAIFVCNEKSTEEWYTQIENAWCYWSQYGAVKYTDGVRILSRVGGVRVTKVTGSRSDEWVHLTLLHNYNLQNSLGHAPFSSLYSQLLLASEFASLITTLHRNNNKHSLYCWWSLFTAPLFINVLPIVVTRWSGKGVYQAVA
jgi:hypothetical protein